MCGGDLESKLKLKPTPIANNFQEKPMTGVFYPLELMECKTCHHVQTRHVLEDLFNDYKYHTPRAVIPELKVTAERLSKRYPEAKVVLEIGANNGINVEVLNEYFPTVIGVDPAGEFPVWRMPFDESVADLLLERFGQVDIIIANNVFAHIDNLQEVFRGIKTLLKPDGVLVIEFNYFADMARQGHYDTIYHEHVDQHTLAPWTYFLSDYGLKISNFCDISAQGGSIRMFCKSESIITVTEQAIDWDAYYEKIESNQKSLLKRLPDKFCLWGATAKATTLIHQLQLYGVDYCVDNTPAKQGLYLPGTNTRIVPEFLDDTPVLLTAWNFEKEFKEQFPNKEYFTPYA